MNMYTSGEWTIDRDNYGIDHGLFWGLWHNQELVDWCRTLKGIKSIAARMGQIGEWTKKKVQFVVVEK